MTDSTPTTAASDRDTITAQLAGVDAATARELGWTEATEPMTTSALLPAESIALTVALAQVRRGEHPDPNTAAMCVLALARLAGRYDWSQDQELVEYGEASGD